MSDTIIRTVKFGVPEGRKSHLYFGQIHTCIHTYIYKLFSVTQFLLKITPLNSAGLDLEHYT